MILILGLLVLIPLGTGTSDYYLENANYLMQVPVENGDSKCHLKTQRICYVECTAADSENLHVHINAALQREGVICNVLRLHLTYVEFNTSRLSHQWLNKLERNISVLNIEHSWLYDIGTNVFENHPFQELRSLSIIDSKVCSLSSKSFLGLKYLINFTLHTSRQLKLFVQKAALQELNSLADLNIKRFIIVSSALTNLTGSSGVRLVQLITINLSENVIEELPNKAFICAPNLATLYLNSCKMKYIQRDAFVGCQNIRQLNLQDNFLYALPEGVFRDLTSILDGKLLLNNNRWNCLNCSLEWLKEFYITTSYIDKSSPLLCNDNLSIDSVDFCDSTEPNSNDPITNAVIVEYGQYLSFNCQKLHYHGKRRFAKPGINAKVFTQEIIIQNGSAINLTYYEIQDNPTSLLIDTMVNLSGYNLIRFAANNKNEINCVTNFDNEIVVDKLDGDTTYMFVLSEGKEKFPSPRSCFSITTDPEWKERPWIYNKHIVLAIALLTTGGVLVVLLPAFTTYLYLRGRLISKEKTIINSEISETTEVHKVHRSNSYCEATAPGYLTPVCNKYTSVYYGPLLDSCKRNSTISSCVELEVQKLFDIDMRLEKTRKTNSVQVPEMDEEFKPPLPPPNPPRRRLFRMDSSDII